MGSAPRVASIWRFGAFEMESRTAELRRNGIAIKLQDQPAQLLLFLLEHAGEIVTREDLRQKLWAADTFVDFDHALNTAIMKVREALGDASDRPLFIQTIPRKGYRFVAPVTELSAMEVPQAEPVQVRREVDLRTIRQAEAPVQSGALAKPDRGLFSWRWLNIAAGVLTILVLSAAFIVERSRRQPRPTLPAALTARPFTALPGRATSPAFSPDGSRIAFSWNGNPKAPAKGFDLYVKALGSETLLRLTEHPSEWVSAAWSPDGTQIAFYRMDRANTGIYIVPSLGGPERKLRSTQILASDYATVSWSPDGKWLAFTDRSPPEEHTRMDLLSMDTLEAYQVPSNPECIHEGLPAISHTGQYLAYWCLRRPFDAVLYLRPFRGGQSKAVSSFRAFPNGLTWSADDKRLIYSLKRLGSGLSNELGQVSIENGSTQKLDFAASAQQPTVLPKGDKLAYSSVSVRLSLWRRDLIRPETPAVELIPSSRAQFDAQYSPEGGRLAFASLRSGVQGVWISSVDGTDLVQISDPNNVSGSPQWSPDGSRIAFDSHPGELWEIYESDVAEQKPRKLQTNHTNVVRPHWSRDGRWIYFSSLESGNMGVYRCPASGGDATKLSQGLAINAAESLDGKVLFFAKNHEKSTLKQVALPPQSGAESKVEGLPPIHLAELWTLSRSGIYFVPADAPRSLHYFDFTSKQVRPILEVDRDFGSGLSVSPDGRWIMYSLVGEENSDIMLADHFN